MDDDFGSLREDLAELFRCRRCAELGQLLAASQKREAELRSRYEVLKENFDTVSQVGHALQQERDRLLEAAQRIAEWADAYPLEAFREQDLKRADSILAANGISMSAMHGQWARRLIGGIGRIARQALAAKVVPS